MATLTVTTNYTDDTLLTQAQLDAAFDSVETFLNTTKLNADNIKTTGITTALLAANAVTAAKINASAITTIKLDDLAVATAKINTLAVTYPKLGPINSTLSDSSGSFSTESSSYVEVTNLSATITTVGRPTMCILISDETAPARIGVDNISPTGSTQLTGFVKLLRDSTDVCEWEYDYEPRFLTNEVRVFIPPSGCSHIDFNTGTSSKTYTVEAKYTGNGSAATFVANVKLLILEL